MSTSPTLPATPELTQGSDASVSSLDSPKGLQRAQSQRYSQVSFVRSQPLGLTTSKSMHLPSHLPSPDTSPAASQKTGFNRRAHTRRSDSLPSFPRIDDPKASPRETVRVEDLPRNPKTWLPSQLAVYLAHILKLAPPRMRDDLASLVSKNGLTGRKFLRMSESDYRLTMGLNPAWTRVFLEAKASLRMECLRARILGEADFEEAPQMLGVPAAAEGEDSWKKHSWRRTKGSKSKGRVKGMAHLFETPDSDNISPGSHAPQLEHLGQPYRSRSSSIQSDDSLAESDNESVDSAELIRVDWSSAQPLQLDGLTESAVTSPTQSSEESAADDTYMTVKEPPASLANIFVQADTPEHATVKSVSRASGKALKVPVARDVFQAAEIASEGMEDMAHLTSRNGSMVLVKKSQLAELEARMHQMEDMLDAMQAETRQKEQQEAAAAKRKQLARPLAEDISLTSLGGYMVLTALGVGVVAVEVLFTKFLRR